MNVILVGYYNTSKAYRIYKKEGHEMKARRDVIFDEGIAFKKSKDLLMHSDDEELPIFAEECTREEENLNHEDGGPNERRKRPNWLKSTLLDVEVHGATKGKFREIKKP